MRTRRSKISNADVVVTQMFTIVVSLRTLNSILEICGSTFQLFDPDSKTYNTEFKPQSFKYHLVHNLGHFPNGTSW